MPFRKKEPAAQRLTREQFDITQNRGAEAPWTRDQHDELGLYVDIVSGEPLFASSDRRHSGSGWPSFPGPIEPADGNEGRDMSHGMVRAEVRSTHGDDQRSEVFSDGSRDRGGMPFRINSAALRFIPRDQMKAEGYGAYLAQVDGAAAG